MNEFYKRKLAKDGHFNNCKRCAIIYASTYRDTNIRKARKTPLTCRVISKNRNRRLYDQGSHTFTSMDDLYRLAKSGIRFKVIEVATKRDITRNILLILNERDKEILSEGMLRGLIYCQSKPGTKLLNNMLEKCIKSFLMSFN